MPPEQMAGGELTAAADVFAVAVLLMELWDGRPPFRRRTVDEIEAAMRAAHPKASDVDVRLLPLDDTMASAMSLDPQSRPQQADDLGRALRRFLSGVDLGDVARQLGDRVREARAHPPTIATEPRPGLQRPPSRPTATQIGTKTFAARDEVRGLQAMRNPNEESTRRLRSTSPAPIRDVETVAMRPFETGPRAERGHIGRQRIWLGISFGATTLALLAFFLGRGLAITRREPPILARDAPEISAPPVRAVVSSVPNTASSGIAAAPPTGATTTTPIIERAQLTLLGDGTLARVDGISRGACPARATVDPGTHSVTFSFPATGESKSERLTLSPGERTTLRADFTGATPSIRVER